MPNTNEERALEEVNKTFTALDNRFDDFIGEFTRKANVDIKNGYWGNLTLTIETIETIKGNLNSFRSQITIIKTSNKNLNKTLSKLPEDLQKLIKNHQKLAEEASHLKNPTIVQTAKIYLQYAADLISKLCAAVSNFFTQTLPNKASKAKASLTTCFNKFKTAEETLVASDNSGPLKARPSDRI